MQYGLDSAYPPSTNAAKQIFKLGWKFWGGYLGGPRATHAWVNNDFKRLAEVGFVFIPIFVGRTTPYDSAANFTWDQGFNDGLNADALAGECGFNEQQPLWLDAEYGDWQNEPDPFASYLAGWANAVNDAGHKAMLYSDPRTISVLGTPDLVDGTWTADPVANGRNYSSPPVGFFDPSSPPAWDVWQFAFNGLLAGVSVDMDSAGDELQLAQYTPPS